MELTRAQDVVVTRVGLVTSGGVGVDAAWTALREDRAGPAPVQSFPADMFGDVSGFEVAGWKADRFWRDRKVSYYTRAAQFALKASEECLLGLAAEERERLGVVVGTQYSTIHNGHRLLDEPGFMTPIKFLSTLPSSTPTNVSLSLGLRGITTAVSSSAAGLEAVVYARDLIVSGHAPALLAGGAEELSPEVYAGCRLAGVVAGVAESGGLTPGEAGAMLLLEERRHAEAAGRTPLAWIAGVGASHAPGRAPGQGGGDAVAAGRRAMAAALDGAGVSPHEIDCVFAGANGFPPFDEVEHSALTRVFGEQPPPRVTLKARVGETFGAFGAVAVAAAVLSLRDGVAPGGPPMRHGAVLIHDYGCDGSHAALVLRHPERAGTAG